MKFSAFLLVLLVSCIDIHSPKMDSSSFSKDENKPEDRYVNFTNRTNLDLRKILNEFNDIKKIIIQSGNRGSLSFSPHELNGSTFISVISSKTYDITIISSTGNITKRKIR